MARKKVTPFLDEDLWRRFRASCAALDRQPSAELEDMLRAWLITHEAAARCQMRDQGRAQEEKAKMPEDHS